MICRHCGTTIEETVMPGVGPKIMRTIWFDPTKRDDENDISCNGADGQRHEP